MHRNLRVPGSRSKLEFAKDVYWHLTLLPLVWTGCWKELLTQARPECLLDHTLSQIWTSPMMWLFLPSYLNSLCLHSRWWHEKLHLLGSSWIGRRQKSKLRAAGRTYHQRSQFWVRRLQWFKSLSTLAPWSTHQLKAHLISHVTMPSPVQRCRI